MNRDEFEKEYVNRHMGYDPRSDDSKLASVFRLRSEEGYSDTHIDLCWKVQKLKNNSLTGFISDSEYINDIEW